MKKFVVILISMLYFGSFVSSQTIPADSLYLGQAPPGDSAIVFAPGTISLPNRRETKMVYSPNNEECLIGIGINNTFQILYTDFYSGFWKAPVPAYFIPNSRPIEPFFSPDSLHMFFTSFANILMSTRVNQAWQTPVLLASPVNTGAEEYHPATSLDGTLYFCSMRENPDGYLYRSVPENGNYSTVEKLDVAINRHNTEQDGAYDPFIAPDESYIIFSSIRSDGYEQADQYISYNRNGSWTNPKNLGPSINTTAIEYGSYISPDGKYYFFSRPAGWDPGAAADIYWIKADDLIDSLRYTNFTPYVRNPIPDQPAVKGELFTFTIPDSTFVDDDGNNTLTYGAKLTNGSPLPAWLTFDTLAGVFTGTPEVTGTLNIRVTATDTAGAAASTNLKITVDNPVSIDQENGQSEKVMIFPNPANGLINIRLGTLPGKTTMVEIINFEGEVILKTTFINSALLNLADKRRGLYLVKVFLDHDIVTRKICIE
ncbi:MAG: putative Ig domain-containing protein [Bacteroidetes bacterium]|nr:putative Ig domain-containing protein [Bacteroidota bacterium]